MRILTVLATAVALLGAATEAWDAQDHEIFRIRDELLALEGPDVSFYDFVGAPPSASQEEINKAYRKRSRQIHPDKARSSFISTFGKSAEKAKDGKGKDKKPGVQVRKQPTRREVDAFTKEATQRYQLLSVVAQILRGPGRRKYDHFLSNGFPSWRGTGYYYTRYRPGLGTVLFGLFIFGGGLVHYGVLYMTWQRQREFVDRYVRHARRMAWGTDIGLAANITGPSAAPSPPQADGDSEESDVVPRNRKERRAMEKENKGKGRGAAKASAAARAARNGGISSPQDAELTSGPVGTKKRVVAENGKVLIVDSVGNVYLEEESPEGIKEEYLLDANEIPKPTVWDTAVFRLPVWAYNKSVGSLLGKQTVADIATEGDADEDAEPVDEAIKAALPPNPQGESRKRKLKVRQNT